MTDIALKGTGSIPVADLKAAYARGKKAYQKVKVNLDLPLELVRRQKLVDRNTKAATA